ncbi:MAG: methylmalonyl Co-A mutase-associated GTPase MeaB [Candidatus Marinimicrobia bacterium]|nr:methylmalonyl Co-A mutase-associated GTPase MeaB [Candidatus Neomarinimicrobiota bacterium]MCF7839955.1 methylmalonyl Co-A mutase-associated GTPase MeaB [Candidatus Neomarinimicrobiota bacterium]MCF7902874.1 methylmalonyl Co-A mutase-associated GTPase MeaB [Candidatus Neomarinimicrobiota bacterium]
MKFDIDGILNGKRLAISRALSLVERNDADLIELTDALHGHLGNAYRIGVTGPPGAGKSSLVDRLIEVWRAAGKTVGVISVDPTSPFTGGAILGDRVRMTRHYKDTGVFIRSMATRGSLGGLSGKAQDAADVYDAAGVDIIVFETVGVGQVELDVAQAADTTLVVIVPESGDEIQAMKAGLMEIADIFAVNKADHAGAEKAFRELRGIVELRMRAADWKPPVIKTSVVKEEGIAELEATIQKHYTYLKESGTLKQNFRHRLRLKVRDLILERLQSQFWTPQRREIMEAAMQKPVDEIPSPVQLVALLFKDY